MSATEEYPDYEQTTQEALDTFERLGTAAAIAQVMRAAEVLEPPLRQDFSSQVLVRMGETELWRPVADVPAALQMFDRVEHDAHLGNHLADIGKSLSSEAGTLERSHTVLAYASKVFEHAYTDIPADAVDERFSVLLEDYTRVAALQEEAGDKEGMRTTALQVAPHLLEQSRRTDLEPHQRRYLESEVTSTAIAIGLEHPLAQQLFRTVRHESYIASQRLIAVERFAVGYMACGFVEEGMRIAEANMQQARLGNAFWHKVHDLAQAGETALADEMVEAAALHFPEAYEDTIQAAMSPMVGALRILGKDAYITRVFAAGLAEEDPNLFPLEQFAYVCGLEDDTARLRHVLEGLALTEEQRRAVSEALSQGLDQNPNSTRLF